MGQASASNGNDASANGNISSTLIMLIRAPTREQAVCSWSVSRVRESHIGYFFAYRATDVAYPSSR